MAQPVGGGGPRSRLSVGPYTYYGLYKTDFFLYVLTRPPLKNSGCAPAYYNQYFVTAGNVFDNHIFGTVRRVTLKGSFCTTYTILVVSHTFNGGSALFDSV